VKVFSSLSRPDDFCTSPSRLKTVLVVLWSRSEILRPETLSHVHPTLRDYEFCPPRFTLMSSREASINSRHPTSLTSPYSSECS